MTQWTPDAVLRDAAEWLSLPEFVRGRVGTSAPILRRLGFTAYGQERLHAVRLT